MKFSHSLQLNTVSDWTGEYLKYEDLKGIIYDLQRKELNDLEASLVGNDLDNLFVNHLIKEVKRVVSFYRVKERELIGEVDEILKEISQFEGSNIGSIGNTIGTINNTMGTINNTIGSIGNISPRINRSTTPSQSISWQKPSTSQQPFNSDYHDRDSLTRDSLTRDSLTRDSVEWTQRHDNPIYGVLDNSNTSQFLPFWNHQDSKIQKNQFRQRLINLYVLLVEFKDFAELNHTGFRKIVKKYDKVLGRDLKSSFVPQVLDKKYPWQQETRQRLNQALEDVEIAYARVACEGNLHSASMELRSNLREHIVYERNTVWRDMIEQERKTQAIKTKQRKVQEVELEVFGERPIYLPFIGEYYIPRIPKQHAIAFVCIMIFLLLLAIPIFPTVEQENCFAILVFASLLWATEVMPLFVTALCIPFLVVVLGVLRFPDSGLRMDAKSAAKKIFSDMFSPVIMLLLGGFTLAAALSKHHIAKMMASIVLKKAGTEPRWVLLANMGVAAFLSMWISNVAAPVLCFSLVQPILRTLPHKSPYAKTLVLGIALAANIGGMSTPISSPQNIIAIGNMTPAPTWPEWLIVSIPLCIASILAVWAFLLLYFKPRSESSAPPEIYKSSFDGLNATQYYILGVCGFTIFLWCIESGIEGLVGDMGVIAIIPIVAFFGTGVLDKDDFNNFLWTVIILAMGGISLGKAVDSSGLLKSITQALAPQLANMSTLSCLAIFCLLVGVATSFISHTVGALIILPVVAEVGAALPNPHPRLLVMGSAFMCSGAMALPVSSYPNMNAISLEDSTGVPWLEVKDFLACGIPGTAIVWFCIVTIGYIIASGLLGY